jgi:phosphoribosylformylglycinamidine synthase
LEQLGTVAPKIDNPELLKNAFNAVQKMIEKDLITAGHDRSDGGLITTVLEMAFAGNNGFELDIKNDAGKIEYFFLVLPSGKT